MGSAGGITSENVGKMLCNFLSPECRCTKLKCGGDNGWGQRFSLTVCEFTTGLTHCGKNREANDG